MPQKAEQSDQAQKEHEAAMKELTAKRTGPFGRFLGVDALEPARCSRRIGEVLFPPLPHHLCGDRQLSNPWRDGYPAFARLRDPRESRIALAGDLMSRKRQRHEHDQQRSAIVKINGANIGDRVSPRYGMQRTYSGHAVMAMMAAQPTAGRKSAAIHSARTTSAIVSAVRATIRAWGFEGSGSDGAGRTLQVRRGAWMCGDRTSPVLNERMIGKAPLGDQPNSHVPVTRERDIGLR